jgi:hypothetical protein
VATQGPFFNVGNDDLLRRVNGRPAGAPEVEGERQELLSRGFSAKDVRGLASGETARALPPLSSTLGGQTTRENERFPMAGLAVVVGIVLASIGLYFLLVSPSSGGDVINLQRLTIGETFAICGAIFIGAGIVRSGTVG